jgi:hypothetical protein
MACLGLPDLLRIAESGLAAVPGAAEHVGVDRYVSWLGSLGTSGS